MGRFKCFQGIDVQIPNVLEACHVTILFALAIEEAGVARACFTVAHSLNIGFALLVEVAALVYAAREGQAFTVVTAVASCNQMSEYLQ